MSVKLTKRVVDAAVADDRITFLWDVEVKGFGLRITPAGAKSYVLQYRTTPTAPSRRLTIGRHGSPWTVDQARDRARQLLRGVEDGIDPLGPAGAHKGVQRSDTGNGALAGDGAAGASAITSGADDLFETVAEEFLEKHHFARGNRWPEPPRVLRKVIIPAWRGRRIGEIRRRDVANLLDGIAARAPVQANRSLSVVRKLFNWAVDRGVLEVSPVTRMPRPGREVDRDRTLDDRELAAIWLASEALGWPFGPCIHLLILTAQRRDEVAQMRWSELSPDLTLWTLPRERAKNRRAHEVPLSPAAADILRGLPRREGCDLIFTTTGRSPISGFSKIKERIDAHVMEQFRKESAADGRDLRTVRGLDHWVFHDFRRTVTTNLAKMSVPPHVADRILNHTSGTIRGVAAVYNRHSYLEERRQALDAWAERLGDIVSARRALLGGR